MGGDVMITIENRYEIGYQGHEAYDNASTFADARKLAHALAKRDPSETIYIYDRMAHKDKAELWYVIDGDLRVRRLKGQSQEAAEQKRLLFWITPEAQEIYFKAFFAHVRDYPVDLFNARRADFLQLIHEIKG